MRIKRILAVLLLLCTLAAVFSVEVFAAMPTYEMSKQYKNSKYYENFKRVPLTGDQATDVVAIALSQLGYREGNSNKDLGGTSTDGNRDFVEYNVLYGKVDNNQGNGLSYGYSWCASFVNWCLRQANVSVAASAAAEISCRRWLQKCKDADIYIPKSECVPRAGDMIFFKDAGSQVTSTHIGIVLYSTDKKVYTIEGNTTDDNIFTDNGCFVALKSYSLRSSYIVGYGRPDYAEKAEVPEIDYSGEDMSAGLYVSKTDISVYYDREMSDEAKTLAAKEIFTVKEIYADGFRVEYNSNGKTLEGYADISQRAVQMTAFSSLRSIKYLDEDESRIFRTSYLLPNTEATIPDKCPEREDAGFVGWTMDGAADGYILFPGNKIETKDTQTVLRAVWDTNVYTVTFKDAEGKIVGKVSGHYGEKYDLPPLLNISEGKEFVRWECETENGELSENAPGIIKGNVTYKAIISESLSGNNKSQDIIPYIVGIGAAVVISGIVILIFVFRKKRK